MHLKLNRFVVAKNTLILITYKYLALNYSVLVSFINIVTGRMWFILLKIVF